MSVSEDEPRPDDFFEEDPIADDLFKEDRDVEPSRGNFSSFGIVSIPFLKELRQHEY